MVPWGVCFSLEPFRLWAELYDLSLTGYRPAYNQGIYIAVCTIRKGLPVGFYLLVVLAV